MPDLEWFVRDDLVQIAADRGVAVAQFKGVLEPSAYAAYRRALDAAVAHSGARAVAVHLARPSQAKADRTRMNAELSQMLRDYDQKLGAVGFVILGEGFLNAMLRSMAWLGITTVRPKTPIKIFDDPKLASAFAAGAAGREERDVWDVVSQFQSEVGQSPH